MNAKKLISLTDKDTIQTPPILRENYPPEQKSFETLSNLTFYGDAKNETLM